MKELKKLYDKVWPRQQTEIKKLRQALSWLCSEVERDHELNRLSIDSEQCVKAARELLTNG